MGLMLRRLSAWARRALLVLREEVVLAPLELILHPSPRRLWWLGFSFFSGNALFLWIWSVWLPQPYESMPLRAIASVIGYSLMVPHINREPRSRLTQVVFTALFWLELPVFFSWMYLCNSASAPWLATMAAMVLIYYHVTDWRLATAGTITGVALAAVLFKWWGPAVEPIEAALYAVHAVVFAFAWSVALMLSLSSANLRREQLASALTTMGIMAHELRTPLSTAALIGEAIQMEVQRQPGDARAPQLNKLALRLHALVRNMNHQIDTQINNAKLLQLPRYSELISAELLVRNVVAAYPFQTSRQRDCVRVLVAHDFLFSSSSRQFAQVLDNLIKNALRSLMAADSKFALGALRIEVTAQGARGQISVNDEGMGIEAALLPHIFKPFFSSDHGTGHGLGLAFCRQVIGSAGGTISVKSKYAVGALFTIDLPVAGSAAPRSGSSSGN